MGEDLTQPKDADWARLLDAEAKLEAEIAAAEEGARSRVAAARAAAAAAVADPQCLATMSAARERAAVERQRSELARIAADASAAAGALQAVPESMIDGLARRVFDVILSDVLPAQWR